MKGDSRGTTLDKQVTTLDKQLVKKELKIWTPHWLPRDYLG